MSKVRKWLLHAGLWDGLPLSGVFGLARAVLRGCAGFADHWTDGVWLCVLGSL